MKALRLEYYQQTTAAFEVKQFTCRNISLLSSSNDVVGALYRSVLRKTIKYWSCAASWHRYTRLRLLNFIPEYDNARAGHWLGQPQSICCLISSRFGPVNRAPNICDDDVKHCERSVTICWSLIPRRNNDYIRPECWEKCHRFDVVRDWDYILLSSYARNHLVRQTGIRAVTSLPKTAFITYEVEMVKDEESAAQRNMLACSSHAPERIEPHAAHQRRIMSGTGHQPSKHQILHSSQRIFARWTENLKWDHPLKYGKRT
ncbi:hypothetical protein TNCV_778141 [Trichonephila clavipes]|nr:hypothetical protein TNCV_778141 [Trichonephila clavipes]